jgi:acyl-CoA thioester hydrolase
MFNETDPMGIVWFGRYALYCEEGSAELGRRCGLAHRDFQQSGLLAPVAQYHVDYLRPLVLDEEFTIETSLIWNDGARLNMEYRLVKANGIVAASAWTVQLFTEARTGMVCFVRPPLLDACRTRWMAGEFKDLQA